MQPSTDQLLKAYRMADFERRMFLFLEFRDLRDLFTEIDADEFAGESRFPESRKQKTRLNRLKRSIAMKLFPVCRSLPPAGR